MVGCARGWRRGDGALAISYGAVRVQLPSFLPASPFFLVVLVMVIVMLVVRIFIAVLAWVDEIRFGDMGDCF